MSSQDEVTIKWDLDDIDNDIVKFEECVAKAIATSDEDMRQGFGMEAQKRAREVAQRLQELQNEIQVRKDRMLPMVKKLITEVYKLPAPDDKRP